MNTFYYQIRKIPGWMRLLEIVGQKDSALELEKLDEEILIIEKKSEDYYNKNLSNRKEITEFKKEIEKEYGDEVKEWRIEFLENTLERLKKRYRQILIDYEDSRDKNIPYFLRRTTYEINKGDEIVRRIKKTEKEIYFLRYKKEIQEEKITEYEIIKAKEYSFSELIESKNNFALCPFHQEKKPSFYIKNNFAFCFGCGWTGDTIQFIMETKKVDFITAVKLLQ